MKRKLLSGILASIFLLAMSSPVQANGTRIILDGRPVAASAVNIDGRVLVGIESLADIFGGEVSLDREEMRAEITRGGNTVMMTADSEEAVVNDVPVQLEVPPRIIDGEMHLPLRFLAETFGLMIDWDAATSSVVLSAGRAMVSTLAGTGMHGSLDGANATFNMPAAVFGRPGELIVADTHNNLIRRIGGNGHVSRLSGSILARDSYGFPHSFHRDGALNEALFGRPSCGVIDDYGQVFIADAANNVIRMIRGGNVYTFSGSPVAGFADGSAALSRFNGPSALALCADGYIYVADSLNHVIRRVDSRGNVSLVAGTPGVSGHNDGEALQASFDTPMGIAASPSGRIYVADTNNHLIRVIENGQVTTLAGTLLSPREIFYATWEDFDQVPMGGFADGHTAMFNMPRGLALWGDILLVADSANHRIRGVLPGGEVFTLAGTGYPDYENGAPGAAAFHLPSGLHISGNTLFIADTGNNTIRTMTLTGHGR